MCVVELGKEGGVTQLVFGQDIPPELYPQFVRARKRRKSYAKGTRINPQLRIFGRGPAGVTCKGCVHLVRHGNGNKSFLKCSKVNITSGPATDHFASWEACGKFEGGKA